MADFVRVLGDSLIIIGAAVCVGFTLVAYGIFVTVRNRRMK